MLDKIKRYKHARSRWIAAGKPVRPPEEIQRIYDELCVVCPNFNKDWCRLCGCRLKRRGIADFNKIAMATESCPDNPPKWKATHTPTEETVEKMTEEDKKIIEYEEGKPTITIPSAQARKKAQGRKPQAGGCC
jgi:hypothetical protein